MKNSPATPAPAALTSEAQGLWLKLITRHGLTDDSDLIVLERMCESFDRMREAQTILKNEGLLILDRFGQKKCHPAVLIERDARAAMLAAIKQLELDATPIPGIFRG